MSEVCYISPNAPAYSMRVVLEKSEPRIKFVNKELRLDAEKDAELIAAMDDLIATKPNIAAIIHKVDIEAAEALARAHQALMQKQRGTVQGMVSADDAKRSVNMAIQERDADLASQGASTADLADMRAEMSKDGLEITENSEGKVAPETREGFKADPKPQPLPDGPGPADAKNIFANLGSK